MKDSPWDQLTEEEQKIIASKLEPKNGAPVRDVFNRSFTGKDAFETAALVVTAKNFIDNAGGHSNSEVWSLIERIEGCWVDEENRESAAIRVSVMSSKEFLDALERSGRYDVNRLYEKAVINRRHRHSARFITRTSLQPGMHFVQEQDYPDSWFDIHWDARSSAFESLSGKYRLIARVIGFTIARSLERIAAGLTHHRPVSAAWVRQELRRAGIVAADFH